MSEDVDDLSSDTPIKYCPNCAVLRPPNGIAVLCSRCKNTATAGLVGEQELQELEASIKDCELPLMYVYSTREVERLVYTIRALQGKE